MKKALYNFASPKGCQKKLLAAAFFPNSLLTVLVVAYLLPGAARASAAEPGPAASASASSMHQAEPVAALPKLMVLQARVDVDKSQHIDAAALTNLISKVAADQGKFTVLSYADVVAMLDHENQKQLLGCTETSCMAEIGQSMGAQFLLYAQIGQIGDSFVSTVNLLDVEAGKVKQRQSLKVRESDHLIEATEVATRRVFGHQVAFREPAPVVSQAAQPNYLSPTKWGLLGAAGLLALGGLGATGFAMFKVSQEQSALGADVTEMHNQATIGNYIAVGGYSLAGLLAVGSGVVFVLDALTAPQQSTAAQDQKE